MDQKYFLGVVIQEPFPLGMAATNRVLSYITEIAKKKNVKVYIPLSTEFGSVILNKNASGRFKGVDYEYLNNTTLWPKNSIKIIKLWLVIKSLVILVLKIKKDKPNAIIFYSNTGFIRYTQFLIIKIFCSTKIFFEETEFPKFEKKINNKILKKIIFSAYGMADGMIVMTENLNNYYKKFKVKNMFLLPMTVDFSRFKNIKRPNEFSYENYFVYVGGNGGIKRDGLKFMIEAFSIFKKKHLGFKLLIVGPISQKNQQFLLKNIHEKSIIFTGPIPSQNIPYVIKNSIACIMTPCKEYNSGGFPTKLGEYLLSGKPVITSSLDSILEYLNTDSAIMFEPNCLKGCVSSFEKAVLLKNDLSLIAQNGYDVCEHHFNPNRYRNELIKFLEMKE